MKKLTLNQKAKLNLILSETYYDLDGFIYQEVAPNEVTDLICMDKEVFELHEDGTESSVETDVNQQSIYGIEVGFLEDIEKEQLFGTINKNLGLTK